MSEPSTQKGVQWWRTIRFTLFSISAGIIQIAVDALLLEVAHLDAWLSYLIALVASVLWNFTFNRRYTFRSDASIGRAMLLVALYYAVFTPLSVWWTYVLTGSTGIGTEVSASTGLGVNPYLVLAGTMIINFVTEFLFQRFVVYRDRLDTNDIAAKESTEA